MENAIQMIWEQMRPNQDESAAKLYGVRAEYRGMRMECHLKYTVADGLHASWECVDGDHFFSAAGKVLVTKQKTAQDAFEKAKETVMRFALIWIRTWSKES